MKAKIINDPVHGFITVPKGILMHLLNHPWFQRLRRIKQLGIADYVYPGALHTRFHHALGAMHLMGTAVQTLRSKGVEISEAEAEAVHAAILLHDIGHGPFSHALEKSFVAGCRHEQISLLLMQHLNRQFSGNLSMAIEMFEGRYPRRFFHQLISSQLDVDRLDYLKRDSFFTGVIEGGVGSSRILKMLDVVNGDLVIEEKGIYSVEAFLNARRIMYWQVYLHKTTTCAEVMLELILKRAKLLYSRNTDLVFPEGIAPFLTDEVTLKQLTNSPALLNAYASLDDYDIWACIKSWQHAPDLVLSLLCRGLLNRNLFKIDLSPDQVPAEKIVSARAEAGKGHSLSAEEIDFLVVAGEVSNAAYVAGGAHINIYNRNGSVTNIAQASDLSNIHAMQKIVTKHFLCRYKPVHL